MRAMIEEISRQHGFFRAQAGRHTYGEPIGILVMDALIPRIPGDVGNATTFPFPVRYQVVPRATLARLIRQRDPGLLSPFVEAGLALSAQGVRAVTTTCGFMILFQQELAEALPVPVFTSSLLQLPFIQSTLKKSEKIGILTADGSNLTENHILRAGGDPERVVILGLENRPHFYGAILGGKGELDLAKVRDEVVDGARTLGAMDPKIRVLLLECANLPPYSAAIQEAVNLPVYDFVTMVKYVYSAMVQTPFRGYL
jgi:hypothetical protein